MSDKVSLGPGHAGGKPKYEKLEGFDFWRQTLKGAQYVVAPMVEQSELAWRILSRRHKAELCYTPMFHAAVFCRDTNYRKENMATCSEDKPLIVQFCANDPETMVKAAKMVETQCDAVDLNLGCPQVIARKGHYGAFLQDEWELLHKIVSRCHEELKVPITCKIRMFPEVEKTVKYAKMLESAGCQLLTVHGRTKEQKGRYTGLADWKQIKAVKDALNIPVFANGNIQYLDDVHRCLKETGVDGVMTAEGNLYNPALFDGVQPSVWQVAEEYLLLVKEYPCPLSFYRGHIFKLLLHFLQRHTDMRELLKQSRTVDDCLHVIQIVKQRCLEAEEKSRLNPSVCGDLPYPYWICQPYVRPSPEEVERVQAEGQKRGSEEESKPKEEVIVNGVKLSRNQIKRFKKNPYLKFGQPKREYKLCVSCGNPMGKNCSNNCCKACCRKKTSDELSDCVGHRHMFSQKAKEVVAADSCEKDKNSVQQNEQSDCEKNIIHDEQVMTASTPDGKPSEGLAASNAQEHDSDMAVICDETKSSSTPSACEAIDDPSDDPKAKNSVGEDTAAEGESMDISLEKEESESGNLDKETAQVDGEAPMEGDSQRNEETGETEVTLSKRQAKKLQKKEKKKEYVAKMRPIWRARYKENRKRRLAELKESGQVKVSRKRLKNNTMADSSCLVKVMIDCSFDHLMNEKDIMKLSRQIQRCYSVNRRMTNPLQLCVSSFNDKIEERMEVVGYYKNWDIHIKAKKYDEFLEKDSITYLTSESPNILTDLEPNKAYIIGGLVDHNSQKGLCHRLAEENKIHHARLPIGEFIKMEGRKVLTIDHVFEILAKFTETKNWEEAFFHVIPKRKNLSKKSSAAKNSEDSKKDNEDGDNSSKMADESDPDASLENSESDNNSSAATCDSDSEGRTTVVSSEQYQSVS